GADGSTYLGGYAQNGIQIAQFGPDDKPVATVDCPPAIKHIRLMRLTATGTFLLGSGSVIYEIGRTGEIVWQQTVKGANHIYKAVRLPNGNTMLASGYGAFIVEIAPDGEWVRTLGRAPGQKVKSPKFFADFQILANGNVVIANWMGHKREDSRKGQQIVEYTPEGQIAWTWHNPDLAGCIHGLLLLDGLDVRALHHECAGLLAPVAQPVPLPSVPAAQ
ncbi:MAG: hypothetical protein HN406_21470, partial [Lentisphaerae bacterium]|nr:hypothetical protein [Lentisphaerota bacterium]